MIIEMDNIDKNNSFCGKHVLVTGATGFIGGYLVNRLLSENAKVSVLVREETFSESKWTHHVDIHKGDLTKPDSLKDIETHIDYVVNCAGCLGKWGMSERILREVNVDGTVNLLKRFSGKPLKCFIQISAGGVTGPLKVKIADENYECHPATAYEKTKYEGEQAALALGRELDIPVTVVRPTFTYGPGDQHKLSLFKAVKKGQFAFIGDGESVNHPVYIDDVVSGIVLALLKGKAGEVYIIGGPEPVSKLELIKTISESVGVACPKLHMPRWIAEITAIINVVLSRCIGIRPLITKSRIMMMADNYGYTNEKACEELGYNAEFDLKQGITKTVDDYRQRDWL